MYVGVITGASMGLGEEFARQLAARHKNLVLVARSEEKLRNLADELEQRYSIRVFPLVCDLSREGAATHVAEYLKKEGMSPNWLVNNAGFGRIDAFDSMEFQHVHDMMMVNMVSLVELTYHLLPLLRLSRDARIINVASTASFQPVPYFSIYAATKVFVLHFTEALHEELRGTDVKVTCLCPGPTPTNFAANNDMNPAVFDKGQSASEVVRLALQASDARRCLAITQRLLPITVMRFFPRFIVRRVAGIIARRMINRAIKTGREA